MRFLALDVVDLDILDLGFGLSDFNLFSTLEPQESLAHSFEFLSLLEEESLDVDILSVKSSKSSSHPIPSKRS